MQKDTEMVIRIPKEALEDFRLFTVLHGGKIVETKNINEEKKEK